jgi:hypothetical protein
MVIDPGSRLAWAAGGSRSPLWNSYNVAVAPVSKTYAPDGTSAADSGERTLAPPIPAHRSIPMFDVVMLAFGLGLFAVGIGYAYACERL